MQSPPQSLLLEHSFPQALALSHTAGGRGGRGSFLIVSGTGPKISVGQGNVQRGSSWP